MNTTRRLTHRATSAAGFALVIALTALPPAAARAGEHEQDEVHRAVQRGDIRALAEILAEIHEQLPGEVAGIEVERENGGRWIYEIRVVDKHGRLFEVKVDARNPAIRHIEQK